MPEHYSSLRDIPVEEARATARLLPRGPGHARLVGPELLVTGVGLDLQELLRINHLIGVHPYGRVPRALPQAAQNSTWSPTPTPAPWRSSWKTSIGAWFDRIVCADELGLAKEEPPFGGDSNSCSGSPGSGPCSMTASRCCWPPAATASATCSSSPDRAAASGWPTPAIFRPSSISMKLLLHLTPGRNGHKKPSCRSRMAIFCAVGVAVSAGVQAFCAISRRRGWACRRLFCGVPRLRAAGSGWIR